MMCAWQGSYKVESGDERGSTQVFREEEAWCKKLGEISEMLPSKE